MKKEHCLIGKSIQAIKIAKDQMALLFLTDAGEVKALADADCCSHTWIEHVTLPAMGFPAKVASVEDIETPDLGSPDEYNVFAYYGCKIITDKGDILIDYRNESNGYYGGSLSWCDDGYFYGGVYAQNISKEEWEDIKDV